MMGGEWWKYCGHTYREKVKQIMKNEAPYVLLSFKTIQNK